MPSRIFATALLAASALTCLAILPAKAAPSTSRGEISVAQVMEMLDKAPHEATARQVLVAYLAGVGETTGVLIRAARTTCQGPLALTDRAAHQALKAAARQGNSAETAATPLLVDDMIKRAGCSLSR
ncbi:MULTISPECIES: hypothetical protein [unclassified Beijerinckia]|uniref:hypothetical protein n=1 Tax=unclassified Beijerinckia TaxID=2638183 RepID=UPI00089B4BF6|nr:MULTISPECIES: hypothetical protein [unclassified Beijerinckia]MDH7795439.1 type IV secretory pathway TrbL component [Beijerinckia sp. GAS462]SEC01625.1 hypothetical protein SAMN05443249_1713 [Beijerinckia sp. 28-YEA-48]